MKSTSQLEPSSWPLLTFPREGGSLEHILTEEDFWDQWPRRAALRKRSLV